MTVTVEITPNLFDMTEADLNPTKLGDKRAGLIPSWTEVVDRYNLIEDFKPGERGLLHGYYRGHRRIAEGKLVRGQKLLHFLGEDKSFIEFEHNNEDFLKELASFIRGPSEQQRRFP